MYLRVMVDDLDCRLNLEVGTEALVRRGKPLPYLTFKSLASRTAHGELIREILCWRA